MSGSSGSQRASRSRNTPNSPGASTRGARSPIRVVAVQEDTQATVQEEDHQICGQPYSSKNQLEKNGDAAEN